MKLPMPKFARLRPRADLPTIDAVEHAAWFEGWWSGIAVGACIGVGLGVMLIKG